VPQAAIAAAGCTGWRHLTAYAGAAGHIKSTDVFRSCGLQMLAPSVTFLCTTALLCSTALYKCLWIWQLIPTAPSYTE
jgi:hypothetical protein